jgi:hypothetical protein
MKLTTTLLFAFCALPPLPAGEPSKTEPKPVMEESWFKDVDGVFTKGEFIDLDTKTNERLYIRYGPISDSGVELERVLGNRVLWRAHVQPLGVEHSKYVQKVFVHIDPSEAGIVWVNSIGAQQIFEAHNLKNGAFISRKIADTK